MTVVLARRLLGLVFCSNGAGYSQPWSPCPAPATLSCIGDTARLILAGSQGNIQEQIIGVRAVVSGWTEAFQMRSLLDWTGADNFVKDVSSQPASSLLAAQRLMTDRVLLGG